MSYTNLPTWYIQWYYMVLLVPGFKLLSKPQLGGLMFALGDLGVDSDSPGSLVMFINSGTI